MSPVYDCTTEEGRAEGVAKAVEAVRDGQIVVIPTDTVYGVGADAFNADAVASVLAAKGRGREMPPPVLVPNVRTVDGLATDVPAWARDLIREFWPGPLTLVFEAQTSLMWDLGETNGTVALRMPQDEIALMVLAEVGPMAVTSANLTGEPPATAAAEAAAQLGAAVAVYLDGGRAEGTEVSTIIDCTGEAPVVLREGAITAEQLAPVLDRHFPAQDADAGTEGGAAAPESSDTGTPESSDTGTPESSDTDTPGPSRDDGIELSADQPRPAGEPHEL